MSGQGNSQYPPNYQDFGGQTNQQVQGAYGQGHFSPNAPPVTRGSTGQGPSNFRQPAVSNPQQQVLQHQTPQMSGQQMSGQQMSGQTNSQPTVIHHMNSQNNYSPLTSSNRNNNNRSFAPQLGGQSDVINPPHVNGQHSEPYEGDAQVAIQTTPNSTPANESSLILAELRKLNAMFQRQEVDRAGIIFDNVRMHETTMSLGMKYVEMLSNVGLNVQKQFSFQTARSLQNDAEANFNHLSGRYSTDGNGYISQSVNLDPENMDPQTMGQQNTNQQNASQQNASQQNINHPNLDPANMNNQNM